MQCGFQDDGCGGKIACGEQTLPAEDRPEHHTLMSGWPQPWPNGFFDLRDPATVVGDLGIAPAGAPGVASPSPAPAATMASVMNGLNAGAPAGSSPAGSPVSLPFFAPAAAAAEWDAITINPSDEALKHGRQPVVLKQSKCVKRNPETDRKYRCVLPDVEER